YLLPFTMILHVFSQQRLHLFQSDESDIPDRETCQRLTEQFAEITGTDEACASFYLQDRKWDLERSVNAFFEATQGGGVKLLTDGDEGAIVVNVDSLVSHQMARSKAMVKARTKAVCKIIFMEQPDIVFLQELIPETFSYIEDKLPEYMCIAGNTDGYFIATLLRRFTVYYDRHGIKPHPGSLMLRNMLIVEAHIGPMKLQLVNTHLESTKDHASERVKQLKTVLKKHKNSQKKYSVIVAGDLNLRDKELELAGGIPPGLEDLWISCGSRKECQYTWDMTRNMNKEIPGRFKPRCLSPVHFGLVGIEKVSNTQCFPSDHWGLQVYFNIEKV
ncbi:hypothetical protein L9F63_028160, partial [Diploptera punctata]